MAEHSEQISPKAAVAIYAVLRLLGASHHDEEVFVQRFTSEQPPPEWRFQGMLGFGGKFYRDEWTWRVGCYREDDTDARRAAMASANLLLETLRVFFETSHTS